MRKPRRIAMKVLDRRDGMCHQMAQDHIDRVFNLTDARLMAAYDVENHVEERVCNRVHTLPRFNPAVSIPPGSEAT